MVGPPTRPVERYALVRRLGEGAMGVVWEAHDRVLDRAVALKFLHDELLGAAIQARLADEARAMARLHHPNVVAVFDVGEQGGRTYLAMELVRGETAERWLARPRTWREIVDLYRGAARGLAAAHAAGIVHRDVKPTNILVGEDGRARVADFGVAEPVAGRRAADSSAAPTGTARYMAPERRAGATADALGDQFALCASLYEALHGRLPDEAAPTGADRRARRLPAWVSAALARGMAAEPGARFSSMTALVAALTPPRRTALWVALAGTALAATAWIAGSVGRATAADPCSGAAAELGAAWGVGPRAAAAARLAAISRASAEVGELALQSLDRATASWIASYRGACQAHARGELTSALYDQRLRCLARARTSIATAAEVTADVTPENLAPMVQALREVERATDCREPSTSDAAPPPSIADRVRAASARVAEAAVKIQAGRPAGIPLAASAVAEAGALGFAPLSARADLVLGLGLVDVDPPGAAAAFARAVRTGLAIGDDALAVEAFARAVYARGVDPAVIGGAGGAELDAFAIMLPIATRLHGAAAFARALLYNNAGVAALAAGDPATARDWLSRARGEVEAGVGADAFELGTVFSNLAIATSDPAERGPLNAAAEAWFARTLGPDHPLALRAALSVAFASLDPRRVAAAAAPACRRVLALYPHLSLGSECAFELAWLADEAGEAAAADAWFAEVTDDATLAAVATEYRRLAAAPGAAAEALVRLADAADDATAWWVRATAADALLGAATGFERTGAAARARGCLGAAITLLTGVVTASEAPYHQRRLARARLRLAVMSPPDAAATRQLAEAAGRWYRAAGGYDAELAAIARITASGSR